MPLLSSCTDKDFAWFILRRPNQHFTMLHVKIPPKFFYKIAVVCFNNFLAVKKILERTLALFLVLLSGNNLRRLCKRYGNIYWKSHVIANISLSSMICTSNKSQINIWWTDDVSFKIASWKLPKILFPKNFLAQSMSLINGWLIAD